MKRISLLAALFLATTAAAQHKDALRFGIDTVSVGYDYTGSRNVSAVKYRFDSYGIEYGDVASDLLVLQMRKKNPEKKTPDSNGKVAVFDLRADSLLWERDLVFEGDHDKPVRRSGELLVYTKGRGYTCIDMRTGVACGKNKLIPYYLSDDGIALAYAPPDLFSGYLDPLLRGVDLRTGKILWERNVDRTYGWNEVIRVSDSTLLVSASGLYLVDLRTSAGWKYEAETGNEDGTAAGIGSAVGIALGFLTGSFSVFLGTNTVGDLASNTLLSDGVCYYASSNAITALSLADGSVRWSASPPVKKMTRAKLFEKDGLICVVGYGTAALNGRPVAYGKSYVAAFRKADGESVYGHEVGEDKKEFIIDILTNGDDELALVGARKIWRFRPRTGNVEEGVTVDTDSLGWVQHVCRGGSYFIRQRDGLHYGPLGAPTDLCLFTHKKRALVLNERYEVVRDLPADSVSVRFDGAASGNLIYGDGCIRWVGADGALRAELHIGHVGFAYGGFLYCYDKDSLLKIDMEKLWMDDRSGLQSSGRTADNSLNSKIN